MRKIWEFIGSASQSRTTALLVVLVIAAAIPLTALVAQRQQNFQQKASGSTYTADSDYYYLCNGDTGQKNSRSDNSVVNTFACAACQYESNGISCSNTSGSNPFGGNCGSENCDSSQTCIYSYAGSGGQTLCLTKGVGQNGSYCFSPSGPDNAACASGYCGSDSLCANPPSAGGGNSGGGNTGGGSSSNTPAAPASISISNFYASYQDSSGVFQQNSDISVPVNTAVDLHWTSNAASCALSDTAGLFSNSQVVNPSGDRLIVLTKATTVTLNCQGQTSVVQLSIAGQSTTATPPATTTNPGTTTTTTSGNPCNSAGQCTCKKGDGTIENSSVNLSGCQAPGSWICDPVKGTVCSSAVTSGGSSTTTTGNNAQCSMQACGSSSCDWVNMGRSNVATCTVNALTYSGCAIPGGVSNGNTHAGNDLFNTLAAQCNAASSLSATGTGFKRGDINKDGDTNLQDFNTLMSCSIYGKDNKSVCSSFFSRADLNSDGTVDQLDYNAWIRIYRGIDPNN